MTAPYVDTPRAPQFPAGCIIKDIRHGRGERERILYACLYHPDGRLLASATLDHIVARLEIGRIANQKD